MEYVVVPFEKTFDRKSFDCGIPALNRYLKEQAAQDIRNYYAVTFVTVEESTNRVVGFYTLSNAGVDLESIPEDISGKLPKYPSVPAIRIGRLAVDKSLHRRNLGSMLLSNAIHRSVNKVSGWAVMLVDAKDETSAAFYKKFGFTEFHDDHLRLFIMRRTIEDFVKSRKAIDVTP